MKCVLSRVGESVESTLSALAAIFSALSAYFSNFRQKIRFFDASGQKRVLFYCFATKQCLSMLKMLSVTPTLALTATLWQTLALSGSLLLSNFAYTALARLTGPLLGSQRRCHDDTLSPALGQTHWKITVGIVSHRHSSSNHVSLNDDFQRVSLEIC